MDVEYNYNIPNIEQFIKAIKENNFDINKLNSTSEDYPYILTILVRELFKMDEVDKGVVLLDFAKKILLKLKDKELEYFIKAVEYQKEVLVFKETIPFDEEIRRILKTN